MRGKLGCGAIQFRFIPVGVGDQGTRVVGYDQLGDAADVDKRTTEAREPVGLRLASGGAGKGVAGCAQHGDKDAGRANLAGAGVDDRHGRAGVIGEQFLAGAMDLAHGALELSCPHPVVGAECRVLERRLSRRPLIFFPQQDQRDAFALEFLVNLGVVGLGEGGRSG